MARATEPWLQLRIVGIAPPIQALLQIVVNEHTKARSRATALNLAIESNVRPTYSAETIERIFLEKGLQPRT